MSAANELKRSPRLMMLLELLTYARLLLTVRTIANHTPLPSPPLQKVSCWPGNGPANALNQSTVLKHFTLLHKWVSCEIPQLHHTEHHVARVPAMAIAFVWPKVPHQDVLLKAMMAEDRLDLLVDHARILIKLLAALYASSALWIQ